MADQANPPKPELDLPLPEKKIPAEAGLASQGAALRGGTRSKWLMLGIIAVVLLILVGGVFMLTKNNASKQINQPPTQTTTASPTPNLNPNTGTLYGDIKV